jgi:uncharacterized glyoxalase superfamily protein PhnB
MEDEKVLFKALTANLLVEDVDDETGWWQRVLGFEIVSSEPAEPPLQWAMMARGGAAVMFQSRASLAGEYERFAEQHPGGCCTLFVTVSDARALFERVREQARVLKEPETTFYGALEFTVQTPAGIAVVIAEFPE